MELRVSSSLVGTARVVALDGVADLAAVPTLHGALTRVTSELVEVGALIVDLDGLSVLDDVALGLLIGAASRTRAAGAEFIVVCTNERMLERLASTRVDRIVRVDASIAAAVATGAMAAAPGDVWTRSGSSATS